jgi:hypothetical protein
MRTTISVSDESLEAAKRRARERGQTLGQFVDAAIHRELNEAERPRKAPPAPIFRGGTGPRPGVGLSSNRVLIAGLDDGVELEKRR